MSRFPESAGFWIVIGCVNITIPLVIFWNVHTGEINRSVALYTSWICFVGFNVMCLFGAWSRDRRRGRPPSRKLIVQVAGVALPLALLTTIYVDLRAPENSYAALAMSDTPLDSIQPEWKRLVVQLIRERAANSKEYESEAAHMQPISPPLYSPESFASVEVMTRTAQELQHAFELDDAYAARLRESMANFREKMRAVDPAYLQAWESARTNEEDAEANIFALEGKWDQSVRVLYEYAAAHQGSIRVRNGSLDFSSPPIKAEFESDERASEELQRELQMAREALVQNQQRARSAILN